MAIFAIYQLSNIKSVFEYVVDRRYSTVAAAEEIRQSSTRQNLLLQYAVLSADTLKEAAEVMVYVSLPKVPFTFRDLPTY